MSGGAASVCRSYIVAATIGAVEALKDHGIARWNYPLRTIHQRLKNNIKSKISQSSRASSSAGATTSEMRKKTVERTDNSIRKVMELDCWGPTTLRF